MVIKITKLTKEDHFQDVTVYGAPLAVAIIVIIHRLKLKLSNNFVTELYLSSFPFRSPLFPRLVIFCFCP